MKFPNYALGLFTGFCLAGLYFIIPGIIESFQHSPEPQKMQSTFQVVDNYDGCDIVRWNNPMLAEYKYFIKCPK